MKTIIGLAGVKTSGKSTVANMIKEFVAEAHEVALADKLKNTCAKVFNLKREQFDKQNLKEVPFDNPKLLDHERIEQILKAFNIEPSDELMNYFYEYGIEGTTLESPRKIAQVVGTEVLRAAGNDDIHCENLKLDKDILIVSDVRFPNELNYFNKLNSVKFIPIYIQRDEAEKHVDENSHPSEKSVFEFSDKCIKLDNNGSLRNTELQVKQIIDKELFGYGQ